jgi:hypothetical protein
LPPWFEQSVSQFVSIFAAGNPIGSVIAWSIGLICMLVVMFAVIAWLRKRMSPTQEQQTQGFTLADLRELRKQGAMSEEEFERAKAKIVQGVQAALTAKARRTEKTAPGEGPPPSRTELK